MSHKIDYAALLFFPTLFVIFMLSYWVYYTDAAEH
jgi:hypothetical protein